MYPINRVSAYFHAAPEREVGSPQPMPRFALVTSVRNEEGWFTAITRPWRMGDASKCRLCPIGRCTAHDDVCQVVVNVLVPEGSGCTFSTVGFAWVGDGRGFGYFDARPGESGGTTLGPLH